MSVYLGWEMTVAGTREAAEGVINAVSFLGQAYQDLAEPRDGCRDLRSVPNLQELRIKQPQHRQRVIKFLYVGSRFMATDKRDA